MKNKNILGALFSIGYSVMAGLSWVFVSKYEHQFPALQIVLYNFLISTIFFWLINIHRAKQIFCQVKKNIKVNIVINITSVLAWFTAFYCLIWLPPSLVVAIVMGLQPVISIAISIMNGKSNDITWLDKLLSFIVFLLIASLSFYYIYSITNNKLTNLFYILLSYLSALGTAWSIRYADAMARKHFTTSEILSLRFIFLIFLAIFLLILKHESFIINQSELVCVFLTSLFTVIIPMFLMQSAINYIGSVKLSFIIPLLPVITYILQIDLLKSKFNEVNLSLLVLLSVSFLVIAVNKLINLKM